MKVIIPMAGLGSRFANQASINPAFARPKPLILVRGIPMIRWATGALPFIEHQGEHVEYSFKATMKDLIFIILQEHEDQFQLTKELKNIYSSAITVIKLPALTRGAAETAYQAKNVVNPEEPIIVSDCDHYFNGLPLANAIDSASDDVEGIIPVFEPPDDGIARWSYSLVNPQGQILCVREKDPELMKQKALANIGAYYFSKARFFMDEVKQAIDGMELTGQEGRKEFFVAPTYDRLIKKGKLIQAVRLERVWGLGTPDDLEDFLKTNNQQRP